MIPFELARTRMDQGDMTGALAELERALGDPLAASLTARCLACTGRFAEATEILVAHGGDISLAARRALGLGWAVIAARQRGATNVALRLSRWVENEAAEDHLTADAAEIRASLLTAELATATPACDVAAGLLERASAIYRSLHDPVGWYRAQTNLLRLRAKGVDSGTMLEIIRSRCLDLAEHAESEGQTLAACRARMAATEFDDPPDAAAAVSAARVIAEEARGAGSDPVGLECLLGGAWFLLRRFGNAPDAAEAASGLAREAADGFGAIGWRLHEFQCYQLLAHASPESAASESLERAISIGKETGFTLGLAILLVEKGVRVVHREGGERSMRLLEPLRTMRVGRRVRARIKQLIAHSLSLNLQTDDALALLHAVSPGDGPEQQIESLTSMSVVLGQANRHAETIDILSRAIELADVCGYQGYRGMLRREFANSIAMAAVKEQKRPMNAAEIAHTERLLREAEEITPPQGAEAVRLREAAAQVLWYATSHESSPPLERIADKFADARALAIDLGDRHWCGFLSMKIGFLGLDVAQRAEQSSDATHTLHAARWFETAADDFALATMRSMERRASVMWFDAETRAASLGDARARPHAAFQRLATLLRSPLGFHSGGSLEHARRLTSADAAANQPDFHRALSAAARNEWPAELLLILEASRGRTAARELASRAIAPENIDAALRIEEENAWLDAGRYDDGVAAIAAESRHFRILEKFPDTPASRQFIRLRTAVAPPPEDLIRSIPNRTTGTGGSSHKTITLAYFALDGRVCAVTLDSDGGEPTLHTTRVELHRIASVAEVFTEFRPESGVAADRALAEFEPLLEPARHRLDHNSTLLLVPFGPLHNIPLHAIPIDGQPAIVRWPIAYAPSLRALGILAQGTAPFARSTPQDPPVVLGDSQLDLDWAKAEATGVAEMLGVEPYLQRAASRQVLERGLNGAGIVHAACHAHFDPMNPDRSAIRCAARPHLTVSDLSRLRRPRTRLVFLSACQGGVVDTPHGDELTGLAHALLHTGIPTVISSQWLLDDEVGMRLTLAFYHALLSSSSTRPVDALREATILTRDSVGAESCYLWAPFALHGVFW